MGALTALPPVLVEEAVAGGAVFAALEFDVEGSDISGRGGSDGAGGPCAEEIDVQVKIDNPSSARVGPITHARASRDWFASGRCRR